jgi:hypothetical protein
MVLIVLFGLATTCVGLFFIIWLTPSAVRYTENIVINAPAHILYDNIRLQTRLMQWSAWPSETGSTCSLENTDGEVGARTVFFTKGQGFGYQEVSRLIEGQSVELSLYSKGPPQKPVLIFHLTKLTESQTEVCLYFENSIERPFNFILRIAGIVRWTRKMHRKDLEGLKRFSEPPYLNYIGQPVSSAEFASDYVDEKSK